MSGKKDEKKFTKKKRNDYFEMMAGLTTFSCRAAAALQEIFADYHFDQLSDYRQRMHAIEHAADEAHHELLSKLVREFMTPIERDDILSLVSIIDDVTDAIDDVVGNLYMFGVKYLPPEAARLTALVCRCTIALEAVMRELHNFKKSNTLHDLLVEVNHLEGEADEVYMEASRALYASGREPLVILSVKQVYDCLENCCDLCEHAADVVQNVILRNT